MASKKNHASALLTLWVVVIAAAFRPAHSAEPPPEPDAPGARGIKWDRLALVGGSGATFRYLGFKYMDRAWYQGRKQDHIRWINDWSGETYLSLDKTSHFMNGLFMAQSLTDAYAWSGFGRPWAALLGTLTSWAALLEVEMRDAHFDQWGFSIPDFIANTAGASVPLAHTLFPATRALRFKFSYHPSALYLDRKKRAAPPEQPHIDHLIDDYEGMTFWMTVAIDEFLRGRAEEVWPDYLGLALGYGAVGLHGSNVKSKGPNKYFPDRPDARPEFFVALDYDTRFLPGQGRLWRYLKTQLNWIHWPTPALRIYPSWRLYLVYL